MCGYFYFLCQDFAIQQIKISVSYKSTHMLVCVILFMYINIFTVSVYMIALSEHKY